MLLQKDRLVLSEPHQARIGLRFPFLVVECKGSASGGNLFAAQNQAAGDGACALKILQDLQNAIIRIKSHPEYAQYNLGKMTTGQAENEMILFSVTTEGPLHEIWVHFRIQGAYHMTCRRAWRTTRLQDAMEFVEELAKIVEWGKNGFRENILSSLTQVEEAVLGGILIRLDENADEAG